MAKIRVYELANELKIQSKDVIKFLEEKNITGKTAVLLRMIRLRW